MFITFEGPDGCGKTTQIKFLAETLKTRGLAVYTTREPGGTSIGDQIRQILLSHENKNIVPSTEILLFLASRAQHTEEVIRPRLTRGEFVLSDRYRDSTIAYQGYGHNVDLDSLHQLNDFATNGLMPDLTILLDVNSETGLRRRASEGDWNRLDAKEVEFHQRVREGFHNMAVQEPQRWVTIDGGKEIADVKADVQQAVLARLKNL
jgi:dTMP kinase